MKAWRDDDPIIDPDHVIPSIIRVIVELSVFLGLLGSLFVILWLIAPE